MDAATRKAPVDRVRGVPRSRGRHVALRIEGAFVPLVAVVVYLGLSVFFFVDPQWIERVQRKVTSRKS